MSITSTSDGAAGQGHGRPPSEFNTLDVIKVTIADGTTFVIRLLPQDDPAAPVVLLLPAMAIKAKFYLPFMKELHGVGLTVASCDLRGQGESTPRIDSTSKWGYHELIEDDLPVIIGAVRERFPNAPLYLFGHSLGGQIALLRSSIEQQAIAGLCLIGTGTVHFTTMGWRAIKTLPQTQAMDLVTRLYGYFPGKKTLGFPGAQARNVMLDWTRHSRNGRYQPRGSERDFDQLLRELDIPALVISLDEDVLGMRGPVDALCRKFPAANLTRLHLDSSSGMTKLDHFTWVRDSTVIAQKTAKWITDCHRLLTAN